VGSGGKLILTTLSLPNGKPETTQEGPSGAPKWGQTYFSP